MMTPSQVDVLIVGAGIGGLSLAYALRQRGRTVRVCETSSRPGGWIQTRAEDGWLFELGPNSTFQRPAMTKLVAALGLQDELLLPKPAAKKRFVVVDRASDRQQLLPLPQSFAQALTTPIVSTSAKCRLLLEPFVRRTTQGDESVASFVSRRFGSEITSRLVAPALTGIWAADIDRLSTRSALPRLWELEQRAGSVVLGILTGRLRSGSDARRAPMVSFRSGMQILPNHLTQAVGPES
ncbi:MAG: protoporphyrinogen oxidase, partial [Bdellovibrionales bacterium]|nr:protoporphyrinogen oxidase [Bdellovibrionales bacterium]